LCCVSHVVLPQHQDVSVPVAYRRHVNLNDIQPMEQVREETMLRNQRFEVPMGSADEAYERDRAVCTDAEQTLRLQKLQDCGLRVQAHLVDVIKKEGPVLRLLDETGLVAKGSWKAVMSVAEQVRPEQCRRGAFAVRYDEWTVATLALCVNQPPDRLGLSTRLAMDQYVCLRACRERNLQAKGLNGSTASYENRQPA
jgi:hypothetical protein